MDKAQEAKKRKLWRAAAVVGVIFSYMVFLVIVSHLRAPVQYINGDVLAQASDFAAVTGAEPDAVVNDGLRFASDTAETETFAAPISLTGLNEVAVSFTVDCPAEYAGALLHVDLYADGYDRGEQESVFSLQEGENTLSCVLPEGDAAPEAAQVRVFTLDPAGYTVEGLSVSTLVALPRYSNAMKAATGLLVISVTITAWLICKRMMDGKRQKMTDHVEGPEAFRSKGQ